MLEEGINYPAHYCNPGWTVVQLADYFERNKINRSQANNDYMSRMTKWCQNNLPLDSWNRNGVTRYSFRFQFKNAEDAIWFKLVWLG